MNEITIQLFANLREAAGTGLIHLPIPLNCTVEGLKNQVKRMHPSLAPYLGNITVLVDKGHILSDEEIVPQNAEVTLFPPLAGG